MTHFVLLAEPEVEFNPAEALTSCQCADSIVLRSKTAFSTALSLSPYHDVGTVV